MKIENLYYERENSIIDEKKWNKEKWRHENPMDYFKAVYLMQSMGKQVQEEMRQYTEHTIFEQIYKVTRMYIPDTLYKFYSLTDDEVLNKEKFVTLQKNQIYMSDIKDFNDPFDGKAFYYNPEELLDIDRLSSKEGRLIDDFTKFYKSAAFTENDMNCLPMWAHYANNHEGFCVAYDMLDPENCELSANTFPMQYTDKRLDITSYMKKYANMIANRIDKQIMEGSRSILLNDWSIVYIELWLSNIKHLTWQYEKEFRCTMGAIVKGMPYTKAIPKAIYIGMKCEDENRKKLVKIGKQKAVPVYQMNFCEKAENYNLESVLIN